MSTSWKYCKISIEHFFMEIVLPAFTEFQFNKLTYELFAANFCFKDSGISGGGGRGIRMAT